MAFKWYRGILLACLCGALQCHTTQDAGYCGDCITDPSEPCNEDRQCKYIAEQPYCNASSQRCETCDCDQDADLSWCHAETGSCVQCLTDSHCDSDKPVCRGNECVQCTPETEEADCGAKSCNPATLECTGTTRATVDICEPCVSDSECEDEDAYCVPMQFRPEGEEVTELGGYCLTEKPQDTACSRPLSSSISRTTLSGVADKTFCGVAEPITTCRAVLDLTEDVPKACDADTDCGIQDLNDGICDTPNVGGCTYACNAGVHCPDGFPCPGGGGYCGEP